MDENLKVARKFPVQNEECRFAIRFKGNLFSHKALKLSIRFKNFRFKKELTSRKFEFKGRQKISG